ncbi:hypothetical protein IPL68_08075 [Candidatus Saccharibacteria bacterium]|nr:MAG: hypothetical protein IPL68_08075 [Candidatus Saccharibacteria bacterium]
MLPLSVLPSLLDKVHGNIKAGHDEFALFELGKGHDKNLSDDEGLPKELEYVELVYAAKNHMLVQHITKFDVWWTS